MSASQPEIGFSNSSHAAHAPDDVMPEFGEVEEQEPGFTNAKSVGAKRVTEAAVEDKAVKKTAAKKKP